MKLNKHVTTFIGIFLGINIILFITINKYFSILFHQTIYICQEMAKTLLSSLPNNIGLIVFGALFLIIAITAIRLLVAIFKIISFKMMLNKNFVSSSNNISIINSPKPIAFCFGIRNPKIYVSTKLIKILTKEELEIVIAHENYHLKNHDTQVLTLATILESLTPYFPVLTDLIKNYKVERELLADEFAISNSNNKNLINEYHQLTI